MRNERLPISYRTPPLGSCLPLLMLCHRVPLELIRTNLKPHLRALNQWGRRFHAQHSLICHPRSSQAAGDRWSSCCLCGCTCHSPAPRRWPQISAGRTRYSCRGHRDIGQVFAEPILSMDTHLSYPTAHWISIVIMGLGDALGHPSPCIAPGPSSTSLFPHVPAGCSSVCCQDSESPCVVPAEAHGEEHEVAAVGLIPAWSSPWRGQHKPNLVTGRRGVEHQHTSGC